MNSSENALQLRSSRIFDRIFGFLKTYGYAFWSAILLGLFAYLFTFTNKLVTHDDLTYLFGKGATVSSGRWGLELLSLILPDASMPWFHGMVTLIFLAVSMCFAVDLLKIRSPLLQTLLSGLMVCFPSLIGTFGYMFTSSSYGAAFLLAVLSPWFLGRKGLKNRLLGILCCILSLSIYQAYIGITAALLVLMLMDQTLYGDEPARKLFLRGLWYVACLAISLGIYWTATGLIQKLTGTQMNSYASGALHGGMTIPQRLVHCIRVLGYILLLEYQGLVSKGLVQILHLVFLAVIGFELLVWLFGGQKKDRICLLLFLLAVFPFTLTSILLFADTSSVHTLVLYGFAGVYLLAALILDRAPGYPGKKSGLNRLRALGLDAAALCLAVIVFSNAAAANRAGFNLHMRYENNYSMSTGLLTRLEMLPGFTQDTPVALIGQLPNTNDYDHVLDVSRITGVSGEALDVWPLELFFRYYCGIDLQTLEYGEYRKFIENQEFLDMPYFPAEGSVRMIDGTAVCKLSPWRLPDEIRIPMLEAREP